MHSLKCPNTQAELTLSGNTPSGQVEGQLLLDVDTLEERERTIWLPDVPSKFFDKDASWLYTKKVVGTEFEPWAEEDLPRAK